MTSYNGVAYRGNKTKGGLGFSNTAMNYLIEIVILMFKM